MCSSLNVWRLQWWTWANPEQTNLISFSESAQTTESYSSLTVHQLLRAAPFLHLTLGLMFFFPFSKNVIDTEDISVKWPLRLVKCSPAENVPSELRLEVNHLGFICHSGCLSADSLSACSSVTDHKKNHNEALIFCKAWVILQRTTDKGRRHYKLNINKTIATELIVLW